MDTNVEYDPLSSDTISDPFSVYRKIAPAQPVFWHEQMKSWVVLRYSACQQVLRDNDRFARDPRRVGRTVHPDRLNIQIEDPPAQSELRRTIMGALHTQDIDGVTQRGIDNLSEALVERRGTGSFDFMKVAAPIAMGIINEVVGSMEYEAQAYAHIFRDMTRAMDSGLDPSRLQAGRAAGIELSERVETWFAAEPPAGMIATLRSNEVTASMPKRYVHNTMAGVFNAGFSTLFATTGALIELLASRQDLVEEFRDPAVGASGAHELLRYISPAQATSRYALVDIELDGTQIRAGDTVVAVMASANRDPAVFTAPERIDVRRNPNPHLAFAWGPHVCLGAQLATTWVTKVAQLMATSNFRIEVRENPEYMDTATLRNLTALLVTVR